MSRILFDVLEEKLRELEVERVILPIPQVLHTWSTFLGFSKLTKSESLEFLQYTFQDFQDTRTCQKFLRMSPITDIPRELPRQSNADAPRLVGTCTHVDALVATVIQAERLEWSQVAEKQLGLEYAFHSSRIEMTFPHKRTSDVFKTVKYAFYLHICKFQSFVKLCYI
ncbi:uncharacterized protein LOC113319429 [Papaver somniferum]|uniref:uncharacterized protein LOC113319429 n=1 Tax=Papaver somniferum TaxID=3469 RepID=UPI000E6FFADD|nr:uncharacterized protein LOC113319429 [Papaver somniferum]